MALCARAVVRTVCEDDPSRLQRFAVQFASPATPIRISRCGSTASTGTATPSKR
jgi:hypothetical protein